MEIYKIYLMDMCWDGENWTENERMEIGRISIDGGLTGRAWEQAILKAMSEADVTDVTGRTTSIFTPDVNLDEWFVEDLYGSGEWLEVGLNDDDHMPRYGLEAI